MLNYITHLGTGICLEAHSIQGFSKALNAEEVTEAILIQT
jgi:hypothetical protein